MQAPTTSIVTCTYNMRPSLCEAIDSVLEQSAQDYEYLILDDGSTDGTWEWLQPYRQHSKIRLFRFSQNRGLTAGRNFLLEKVRGKYLSILDADDYLAPHKVQLHAQHLDQRPEVGVVWGCSLIEQSETGDPSVRLLPNLDFQPGWDLTTSYQATHSATTWRKSALLRAGAYDPDYTVVEAVDLFLKLGDFCEQLFCGTIVAYKRIDLQNSFRRYLAREGSQMSRRLLQETLSRRFGVRSGAL